MKTMTLIVTVAVTPLLLEWKPAFTLLVCYMNYC